MESFTTTCTTCGRRLRVNNASLIGQIVSCPKCGGMVQIDKPSESSSGDPPSHPQRISVGPAGDVDSQAITRDSIDGEELHPSTLADPQQTAAGTVFNEANIDDFAESARAETAVSRDADVHRDASGNLPVGWQSDRTRRARQIGLIATLSVTGIIAAAVAFLFFVQRWKENQSRIAQPSITAAETDEGAADASANKPDQSTDVTDEETAVEEPPAESTAASPEDDSQEPDGSTDAHEDETSGSPAEETDASEQDPKEQGERAATVGEEAPEAAASDLLPDAILGPLADEDDPADEEPAAAPKLPPGLQKYTSILPLANNNRNEEERLEKPVAPDQVKLDQPADEEETAFGPAEPIRISSRLRFELAFEKKSAPLTQWLRLLSQITGVPISLDVASLDAAGIAPTQAAEPASGWNAAEAVLKAVAESTGCTIRKTDALVVVEADAETVAAGITPALQADDLLVAANAEQREALSQLIMRVTQAESATIDPANDAVAVEGDASTAWLTALVLDGLRIARQLPPRLPRNRTQRWLAIDQGFDWPRIQGGPGIESIDHPQPIIALIDQVAEANDAAVVFAWGDLWQHGLTPASTAMPWTANVSGGDLLDRMLQPYQLHVRQMSDGLWWVGSETLYDRDAAIGLIHVPDQAGDAAIERLVRSLGATDADELPVAFDESSGYLVAHLPRFLLRQLPALAAPDPADANKAP